MSSDPEDRTSNDNKRPKLDLGPPENTIHDPNQIQLKWKASEFVKKTRTVHGEINKEYFKTSKIKFKGLLWYVRIQGNKKKISDIDAKANTLMSCELRVVNETDQSIPVVCRCTVNTAYHNKDSNGFGVKEPRKSTFTGYCSTSTDRTYEEWCTLSWYESEFPNESCSDEDCMSINVDYLGETISDREARLFQIQDTLLGQMKEEVKGMELLNKWANAENGSGDSGGLAIEEDFVIESKSGTEIALNKALLKVRGGGFFYGCLTSEMAESRTSHVKLENFDDVTILGFKEYLYGGTLPNLDTNSVEYFQFGDFSGIDQIKSMAELELCKNIDTDEFMVQALEIARQYETKYLKAEIMDIWKKDPELMEKLLWANFNEIDYAKLQKNFKL